MVGLDQLQQAGEWLGKEEVETASVDHSFKKLRGKAGFRRAEAFGRPRGEC